LVPVDGSEVAEAALPWAAALARTCELSLTLVRVLTPWSIGIWTSQMDGYMSPELYDQVREADEEAATSYLAALQERLTSEGFAVDTIVREGSPAESILDVADECGAVAIALATHGRGGLPRVALGSVAERLVEEALIPVLLVRASAAAAPKSPTLERLLVPLDGSPLAERALDLAREVAGAAGTLILVRVVPPVERPLAGTGIVQSYAVDEKGTLQAIDETEAYLRQIAERIHGGVAVETTACVGRAVDQILVATHEFTADLLVLSSHGRTGPDRWLLGSVADELVRRAQVPVLLVSARALVAKAVGPYTVRDLMTRDLSVVNADESLDSVMRKLLRRRVGGAPVVDAAGNLVGVLSEHDLLTWAHDQVQTLAREPGADPAAFAQRLRARTAAQVMSRPPVTIEETAPLTAAVRLLAERSLRRLPVTAQGKLVGILTRSNALKALAAQTETDASAESQAPFGGGTRPPG
jgi:nucleotide-binding universal stress UspA family protein